MPDGEGNNFIIEAEGRESDGRDGLWAPQVLNGQALTFFKAKPGMIPVLAIGALEALRGGDRVTFDWVRD